jgi:hypothetical protein
MESTMLTIKFGVFLALELFVLGVLGAALIAGRYQIVHNKVRESRRLDGVTPKARPAARHAS